MRHRANNWAILEQRKLTSAGANAEPKIDHLALRRFGKFTWTVLVAYVNDAARTSTRINPDQ